MDQRKAIGLLGCGMLLVGVFMPIIRVPLFGSQNYLANGTGDGIVILALAVISLLTVLLGFYGFLWLSGTATIFILGLLIWNLNAGPFQDSAMGGLVSSFIQIQWGFGVLLLGAILVLVSAGMAPPGQKRGRRFLSVVPPAR